MPSRAYHHGDLRRAIVQATIELLETTSASDLSLREVARRAGVTSGAPYHHFKTKADLLVDVACVGFEALGVELAAVDASKASPIDRLRKRIEVYLRFALAHGGHYRVMFSPELVQSTNLASYEAVARAGFDGLVAAVATARPDLDGRAARSLARTVWAAAHGFVLLALDGVVQRLEHEHSSPDPIRATAKHIAGMVMSGAP